MESSNRPRQFLNPELAEEQSPDGVAARAATLHRVITQHPEAVVIVLAAISTGPADTAAIVERASPVVGRDTVLDILAALNEAGIITWVTPGGDAA